MTAHPKPEPDLWQRAIDSLPSSSAKNLEPGKIGNRDVALATLEAAEEKRQLSLKKRWRIKKLSGEGEIVVRDVLEKIIYWIRRFRDVGDQVVQYDPGHAALPWAAFRFLLQVAISETTIYSGMVEDLEVVASLMARCRELERVYLSSSLAMDGQLCDALVKLYAAILQFLARATEFFGDSTAVRLLKAPFRSIDEDAKKEILKKEAEVLKVAALIDAERLANIETQVYRLADLSIVTQKAVQEQQYVDVLRWLSDVPYSRHHEFHREARVPGTGQWLIQHPDVRSWISASSCSWLLLHGIPGCGKTALCSAVIDEYLDALAKISHLAPVVYFYCNTSESEPERRTSEGVLRSLARQLTVSRTPQPSIHSAVLTLYSKLSDHARANGFETTKAKISDCVELILAALEDNPATLVIDALDEIDDPKRLIDALNNITDRSRNVVKIFITSRDNPAILAMLPSPQIVRITDDQNKADVRLFATHAVTNAISDHKLLMGNVTQALKERLVDALVSGAGEMFLWVKLQLLHLCTLEHETDLIAASTNLAASTLEELYQAAYERIQQAGQVARDIAARSFAWLLYAREPLTVDAFLSAIKSATPLEQTNIEHILAICRGFVYLDRHSSILRFAHRSVQEFLQSRKPLLPGYAQNMLAVSCLSICTDPPDSDITKIEPTQRIYDYAVLYCGHHCSAAQMYGESSAVAQELTTFFFDDGEPSLSAKIWMDNCRVAYDSLPSEHVQKAAMEFVSNEQGSSLFPICTFGLSDVLQSGTWSAEYDWNERNDHGHTALYAAAFFGHTKVVAFLLDKGADSNVECGRLGSALHCAAYRGHAEVVNLLLDHGADVRLGKFESAFQAACRGNQEEVILTIIDNSGITDQMQYDSALEEVSGAGFLQAMQKLRAHPLGHATKASRMPQMVTKVICSGKVVNLKYLTRNSTLADIVMPGSVALSALYGHGAMTAYLLDQGLDVEEVGELGTPLRCASLNGSSSVCHLLLSRGADVNGTERFGSALHAAAMKGQLHIVKLLLDAGADVNIQGGYYGTPLQAAAYQGHMEVISLLVAAGANAQQAGFSKDAFHAAAEGGRYEVIRLLLDSGCTLSEPIRVDGAMFGISPPSLRDLLRAYSPAARRWMYGWSDKQPSRSKLDDPSSDGEDVVGMKELFDSSNPAPHARAYIPLRRNRDLSSDEIGNYLLEAAAAHGHLEAVHEILSEYDSLGLDESNRIDALIAACKNGHLRVAEVILSRMEEDDVPSREALQEAASHNHVSVVRMLLTHDGGAETRFDRLRDTLMSSIAGDEQAFHEILLLAEKELMEPDVTENLLECLPEAARADQPGIVQAILARSASTEHQEVISALLDTCKNEKAADNKTTTVGAAERGPGIAAWVDAISDSETGNDDIAAIDVTLRDAAASVGLPAVTHAKPPPSDYDYDEGENDCNDEEDSDDKERFEHSTLPLLPSEL